MSVELTDTNASQISAALVSERRKAGSPLMGMVMTFVVVADEADAHDALRHARAVSREHPARILVVIRRGGRGAAGLDAEITIGGSGESVLLRMSGELTKHAESVVLPLLLPDSPIVVWWPGTPPDDTAHDSIGSLAQRRITDCGSLLRGREKAILSQARSYEPGNTDMSWTRLTSWRALLSAALDQYPATIHSAVVEAERANASADLMVAWLSCRLGADISRKVSKGPGITSVVLNSGGGPVAITRPDGLLAQFSTPNAPDRPVALKRRDVPELLAEELRRLDPDEVYAATVRRLCELVDGDFSPASAGEDSTAAMPAAQKRVAAKSASKGASKGAASPTDASALASAPAPSEARTTTSQRSGAPRTSTRSAAEKAPGKKATASRKNKPAASRKGKS